MLVFLSVIVRQRAFLWKALSRGRKDVACNVLTPKNPLAGADAVGPAPLPRRRLVVVIACKKPAFHGRKRAFLEPTSEAHGLGTQGDPGHIEWRSPPKFDPSRSHAGASTDGYDASAVWHTLYTIWCVTGFRSLRSVAATTPEYRSGAD